MNWRYRDIPAAAVIALKRSSFHARAVLTLFLITLLSGLPIDYGLVPDDSLLFGILGVVCLLNLFVSLIWGLVFGAVWCGHFYTALDELSESELSI